MPAAVEIPVKHGPLWFSKYLSVNGERCFYPKAAGNSLAAFCLPEWCKLLKNLSPFNFTAK